MPHARQRQVSLRGGQHERHSDRRLHASVRTQWRVRYLFQERARSLREHDPLRRGRGAPMARQHVGGGVPLEKFELVERIREQFFPVIESGGAVHHAQPTGSIRSPCGSRWRSTGRKSRIGTTRRVQWPMVWPGPKPGRATSTFEPAGGPNCRIRRAMGDVPASRQRAAGSRIGYALSPHAEARAREVKLRIEADSVRNPFGKTDLQRFRCE